MGVRFGRNTQTACTGPCRTPIPAARTSLAGAGSRAGGHPGALTALGTNGAIATKEVADGGREGPHAQTAGSDSAPTGLWPPGAGDRPELPALGEHGERLPRADRRGEARLAAAGGARRRHGARAAALPRRAPPGPHAAGARLGGAPARAPPPARDQAAPLAGVPRGAARRVSVQPVLRAVRSLGETPPAHDAPSPPGGREGVRRLQRREPPDR